MQMASLWNWLPPRITMLQPEIIYSTNEHGSSLTNFYFHTDTWEPTVVAILTTRDEVAIVHIFPLPLSSYGSKTSSEQIQIENVGGNILYLMNAHSCMHAQTKTLNTVLLLSCVVFMQDFAFSIIAGN